MTAKNLIALIFCLGLSACGFHLRGPATLPFDTLAIEPSNSSVAAELERAIVAGGVTRVVRSPVAGQTVVHILEESSDKRILSLSSTGRVREFVLVYRVRFRVHDGKAREYISPQLIELKRDFTFNDTDVLAKEAEEALLLRDMRSDAIRQILARIAAVKL